MGTVVVVHRWGGDSESDWYPWLRSELEKRGVSAIVPDMPDSNSPKIGTWVPFLANSIKEANEDLYLVGHSVGCATVLKYLASLPEGSMVGGVVFVAAWPVSVTGLGDIEKGVAQPWLETPTDWEAAKRRTSSFVAIYSDNDPYVPVENSNVLGEKLNAKLVLDEGRGHFTEEEDVTQLPSVLNELLIMMGLPVETRSLT